jgi:hypothetical protein
MKPSEVSSTLRRIAAKIDNSVNPKREFVAKDLRRIIMAINQQIVYRVITDEPQGVCVGFKPSQSLLDQIGGDIDEWNLVADDGSESDLENETGVIYFPSADSGNDVAIRFEPLTQEELNQGISPLGPDLYIWRNEKDFAQWCHEITEE